MIEVLDYYGPRGANVVSATEFRSTVSFRGQPSDPARTYVTIGNLYRASAREDAYYDEFVKAATRPSLDAAKQRMAESRDEARR